MTSASGNGYIDVNAWPHPGRQRPRLASPRWPPSRSRRGRLSSPELSLTSFSVGSQYAGAQATVYVVHSDGTQEAIPATVAADGTP